MTFFYLLIYNSIDKLNSTIFYISDILIGFSSAFFTRLIIEQTHETYVREGDLGDNCSIFLNTLAIAILLTFAFTNFQARKSLGFMQLIIYFLFLLFAFLSELEIIHPYGTDHHDEK